MTDPVFNVITNIFLSLMFNIKGNIRLYDQLCSLTMYGALFSTIT